MKLAQLKISFSLLALLTALSAPACNGGGDEGGGGDVQTGTDALKSALPDAERMMIRMPAESFLTPDQAEFYAFTRGITLHVNGFVRNISNIIKDVVELPPTDTDDETYAVWGPHTEALSPATWRVRVDRDAQGSFSYRVEGWPKEADEAAAVTVLEGEHTPGDGPRTGVGAWTYHLSAGHELDPLDQESVGDVSVAYDLGEARALEVRFVDVQGPHDAMTTSALYRYTEAADQAGTFDFISNLDIHKDDAPEQDRRELLQVRSRWLPTGPGRADVVATHGDLPEGMQVDLTECWDDAFMRSYVRYDVAGDSKEEGDVGLCPFEDRQTPEFEDFDADEFAEGDLLAAVPDPVDFEADPVGVEDPADETATYYRLATETVKGLDKHVKGVLALIDGITKHPPTDCEPAFCAWGPFTDWEKGVSYRLIVTRQGEGVYVYQMQAKRFGGAEASWVTTIEGGFTEEGGDDAEGLGQGWFDFDFDAVGSIDEKEDTRGSFRAEFAKSADGSRLAVRLDGVQDGPDDAVKNARYLVESNDDGGALEISFPLDIHENEPDKPAIEDLTARVRWLATGPGVANAVVTGGDLDAGQELLAVECWNERAAQTHFAYALQAEGAEGDGGQPNIEIDADACAFDDFDRPSLSPMADEVVQ